MVVGVEHSCTRLVTGLMKVHPQVSLIIHKSVPAQTSWPHLDKIWQENQIGKIVLVTRDRCSNDMSYLRSSSVALMCGKQLAGKPLGTGSDIARSHLAPFINSHEEDVIVVSMESLVQHKELTLRQAFRLLGMDEDGYDYDRSDSVWHDWFAVNLAIKDPNLKYYDQHWPQ